LFAVGKSAGGKVVSAIHRITGVSPVESRYAAMFDRYSGRTQPSAATGTVGAHQIAMQDHALVGIG